MNTTTLAEIDAALASSPDADDALRATVRLLAAQPGIEWAGIAFVETTARIVAETRAWKEHLVRLRAGQASTRPVID